MLCNVEPDASEFLSAEVILPNPVVFDVSFGSAFFVSTFFSKYSMPALRIASVCVKTACATFCTKGADDDASCPATAAAFSTFCCNADGGGGSATVTRIALVCCCSAEVAPPDAANCALKECVPERATHFAENTLLDCAASDTSCDVNFTSSTKKVSVPPTVASVPL